MGHSMEYDSKEAEQHKYNLALSKQLYTEIHNKILKLEKPQLIQVMLTVAKALTDRTQEVHHKTEMGKIVKHHKLGKTGYEEIVDEHGHKMVVKEDQKQMRNSDITYTS
tara:strand:+ start:52 stop:378 length:327 start_codon:yes stop_codon:yes gene_type:complete